MPRDIDKSHTLFNPRGLLDSHHKPDRAALVADLLAVIEQRPHDCGASCTTRYGIQSMAVSQACRLSRLSLEQVQMLVKAVVSLSSAVVAIALASGAF